VLVVAEVSLSLVLLVGAGLLLRSFYRVMQADAGFRPEGVLVASVPLPQTRFPDHDQRAAFLERLLEKARAVPGAEVVGATIPLLGGWQSSFSVEGRPEAAPGQMPSADIARVSPGYFDAMGVVLHAGRVFTEHDRNDAPRVCMIDETFAKKYWPTEPALGKRVKFGRLSDQDNPWMEVVGVVKHVKNYGVDEESRVEMYLPYLQNSASSLTLLVRTTASPASLAPALRLAVKAADPEVPMFQVRPLTELVAERTAQRRLSVILISVFGALALLLAAVGIYGVMSYAVTQQTQEIGIRMALGAERDHILKMVLGHGGMLAALGIGIGLLVSFGMARAISALLFQTSATDPPTFSVVPLILVAVALVACYLPARRATRVDPMIALRGE
jgi:putative ABC transport system permease protein